MGFNVLGIPVDVSEDGSENWDIEECEEADALFMWLAELEEEKEEIDTILPLENEVNENDEWLGAYA